jgi:hypothetical protein
MPRNEYELQNQIDGFLARKTAEYPDVEYYAKDADRLTHIDH